MTEARDNEDTATNTLRTARLLLVVYACLSVLCMVFIFSMSAEGGEDSSAMSDFIAEEVISAIVPSYDTMDSTEQADVFETVTHIVRKCAHMFEYAVFATCVSMFAHQKTHMSALASDKQPKARRTPRVRDACYAALFCVAYACTDEFHQLFVAGRSGMPGDVCIDAVGVAIACVLVWFALRAYARRTRAASGAAPHASV